ncbi:MAG: hypothetical protein Q7V57_08575 [Actinomycetota bacterium]|nr:hypothetical protein [Actinomycetota bacterium]
MDTMMTLKKWQDDYFVMIRRVEEPMVRYMGKMAEPVARYLPERPRFMAEMPMVREFVDNQLKFRRRMVDEQAAFVQKMMKAMDPMLVKMDAMPKGEARAGRTAGKVADNKPQHEELRMPQRKAAHAAA